MSFAASRPALRCAIVAVVVGSSALIGDVVAAEEPLPKTLTDSAGIEFVLIPAGEFLMGSTDADPEVSSDEKPQHKVRITKSFYLGRYELTHKQFKTAGIKKKFDGDSEIGSVPVGDDYPEVEVSWNEAVTFCENRSQKEGKKYRLPTEAEWEYACRAGTTTFYSFGNDPAQLKDYGWFEGNTYELDPMNNHVQLVGLKKPNSWGLYDMHGNCWEWCQDYWDYYKPDAVVDPVQLKEESYRIVRGGSWVGAANQTRSACRDTKLYWRSNIGFRVVREL